jgi:hypothetical protein
MNTIPPNDPAMNTKPSPVVLVNGCPMNTISLNDPTMNTDASMDTAIISVVSTLGPSILEALAKDSDNSSEAPPLDDITTEVFGVRTLSQAYPTKTPGANMAALLVSNS